jgi:REP element-mobilizing transposase RayT
MEEFKRFYRRKLPHLQTAGGTIFVTFRLAGSVPKSVIHSYKNEKRHIDEQIKMFVRVDESGDTQDERSNRLKQFHREWFKKFEDALHKADVGPTWLKLSEIAGLVFEALLHRDGNEYKLYSACIMSNHVHAVFKPNVTVEPIITEPDNELIRVVADGSPFSSIMQSLKGYTARMANRKLNRTGTFWEAESYDHLVRNDTELVRIIEYVLNNPVKAGLVQDWREWQWTYLCEEMREHF